MEEIVFTQEDMDELSSLRHEKKIAQQTSLAEAQLEKYGVPKDFAGFLTGETDEVTLDKVKRFAEDFGRVKMSLASNSNSKAPADEFTLPKRHRGIRRI